jgi:transmembrane sensor
MTDQERVPLRGLKLGWSERRTDALLSRVQVRLGRQKVALRAALASGALIAVMSGVGAVQYFSRNTKVAAQTSDPAPHAVAPGIVRLREGSEIHLVSPASAVRVAEETASHVLVELMHGSARYSVVPNPARAFEVHTGSVTVKVVGTEFLVEERGEHTWVEVSRGKVRVSSSNGDPDAFLVAGESGLFPRAPAASAAASSSSEPEADVTTNRERASVAYRAHLAQKDYRAAFALLSRNPSVAGDSVQDLLLAADVARLSDHPSEAVPYLQRIVREHASDERAPLAAFTLGRTLSGLGRTREAMNMFGRVRSAWSHSPLAEDALVRQAEAAAALGEVLTAKRLAAEYERDYPSGRRRADVRRYAGL